jgi:hypothetical protein
LLDGDDEPRHLWYQRREVWIAQLRRIGQQDLAGIGEYAQQHPDPTLDVFESNNEFATGSSGQPPLLSFEVPRVAPALRSRSYFSANGLPFRLVSLNWSMELGFLPPATPTTAGVAR